MDFKSGAAILKTYEGKVMGQWWPSEDGKYFTAESVNGETQTFRLTSAASAWLKHEFEKSKDSQ